MSDNTIVAVLADYGELLERSPLSPNTRRAYRQHVARYLEWLAARPDGAEALGDPHRRDFAVRDYRHDLKEARRAPATVNAALAALDHLYRHLRLGPPEVRREQLPAQAPRALDDTELRALFRAAEQRGIGRDRATLALMALCGLRVAEVAALDVDDVAISARKGTVRVRHGKGDAARSVPIPAEARALVEGSKAERRTTSKALFVGPTGERLTVRALARIVERAGRSARLDRLSPHVLRHTFVTRLVRSGADVVMVAELAGHRSLETTRRYALPTAEDRAAAVEVLAVER